MANRFSYTLTVFHSYAGCPRFDSLPGSWVSLLRPSYLQRRRHAFRASRFLEGASLAYSLKLLNSSTSSLLNPFSLSPPNGGYPRHGVGAWVLGSSRASQECHPERSGPTFSSAPHSGASGRAVEGSLFRFSTPRPSYLLRALCGPSITSLVTHPHSLPPPPHDNGHMNMSLCRTSQIVFSPGKLHCV
jgi:hypothetical protein